MCRCGEESVVVVSKSKKNAGHRFFGCAAYQDHTVFPDEIDCCYFKQWTDPPMCERGVQYALETQAEIRRLNKNVSDAAKAGFSLVCGRCRQKLSYRLLLYFKFDVYVFSCFTSFNCTLTFIHVVIVVVVSF